MRDLETIHMALTAAETGHLVFGTLHTQSAPQTVDRMVDVFPPEQQGQIRVMLATTLQAVVTQQLVPTIDGKGRVVAAEVLVATPAVRNLIREAKGHQIPTQMQAGAQYGMVTMDQSLAAAGEGRPDLDRHGPRAGVEPRRPARPARHQAGRGSPVSTTYAYKVRDRAGRPGRGHASKGTTSSLVIAKLREMGYVPVSVTARTRSKLGVDLKMRGPKVSLKDVAVFSRQLATMINSGLSILRALAILTEQAPSKGLAQVVGEMREDIERGFSLSQAVARHPKVFPPVYLSMVRAGESGGSLDEVLLRLATTLEKQLELRGKIHSALDLPDRGGLPGGADRHRHAHLRRAHVQGHVRRAWAARCRCPPGCWSARRGR